MSRCTAVLLVALIAGTLASASAGAQPRTLTGAGSPAFSGGAGGGGTTPSPPIGQAPVAPQLGLLNQPFFVRVALVADSPRVVVLRSRDGRLLLVAPLTPGQARLLPVPESGALLDVLGTDVVGLPIAPSQQLTVVAGG